MEDKKLLKEARTVFNNLKTDPNTVLFSEEKIDNRLLKKLKKPKYLKYSKLLKLILLPDNKYFLDDDKEPTRTGYIKKREIGMSALYSFDGPIQLLYANIRNLEIVRRNATFLLQVLVIANLYSSKIYVYSTRYRKQMLRKIKLCTMKLKVKEKLNV